MRIIDNIADLILETTTLGEAFNEKVYIDEKLKEELKTMRDNDKDKLIRWAIEAGLRMPTPPKYIKTALFKVVNNDNT